MKEIKKVKNYLLKKHKEYYDELKGMDMDDISFNFLLVQKAGIEEAIYYINNKKDVWNEME